MDFHIRRQKLAPLLQQALEGIADYGRQFNVTFELIDNAPECEAAVDSDRFLQVMANLLSNAAKFSPVGGKVKVSIDYKGPAVRVAVIDEGKGISPEFRQHVFEKFAQADASDSKQKGGTGLGLSITKSIVEKMSGTISFDSQEGVGTTFYVEFPEHEAVTPADQVPKVLGNDGRPTVLVCENDRDVAELLGLMLEQGGYNSEIVSTASEAKERLRTRSYRALSLNIDLPDHNGVDLFHNLRADPLTRDLPVIVVSAQAIEGKRALNGTAIGVIDWLSKPIDRDRLMSAVQLAVQGNEPRDARILHIEDDFDIAHVVSEMLSPIATIENAHNLREARATLLPVVALSKLLLTGEVGNATQRECLELMRQGSLRACNLVRRILTFARPCEPQQRSVDLLALVRDALPFLRLAVPPSITITEDLKTAQPIWADEGQLNQVLLNLVMNAAHAIAEHPGTIRIEVAPTARGFNNCDMAVRLSVIDTGHGMDDATRRRIFEPFFTTKTIDKGTGLGLSVVHGIVTGHGAMISVDSQPGKGARFDIIFPAGERPPTPNEAAK